MITNLRGEIVSGDGPRESNCFLENKHSLGRTRKWTGDEDLILSKLVYEYGEGRWAVIADNISGRTGKQCRDRWVNQLRQDIRVGPWTSQEDIKLVEGHKLVGPRWTMLAKMIPGRTENSIKNHWYACLRTKLNDKLDSTFLRIYQQRFKKNVPILLEAPQSAMDRIESVASSTNTEESSLNSSTVLFVNPTNGFTYDEATTELKTTANPPVENILWYPNCEKSNIDLTNVFIDPTYCFVEREERNEPRTHSVSQNSTKDKDSVTFSNDEVDMEKFLSQFHSKIDQLLCQTSGHVLISTSLEKEINFRIENVADCFLVEKCLLDVMKLTRKQLDLQSIGIVLKAGDLVQGNIKALVMVSACQKSQASAAVKSLLHAVESLSCAPIIPDSLPYPFTFVCDEMNG
eukprot:CAMPEP_0196583052 /NCGR_PEP_ID=MMETSP1081-20130531/41828_1 /TAXON_ID=36882 /ORGANISM="Pyramimonas amylifera, Strain CCMP720" /LENGTH=402 /DNA_ID=CAMNT_0041903813 /DNA_START=90 /DNA_END=1298 /DNA_ORIENTATION=+